MNFDYKHYSNKFIIAIIFFVAWVIFIDSNSLLFLNKLDNEINKLEQQKSFYHKPKMFY